MKLPCHLCREMHEVLDLAGGRQLIGCPMVPTDWFIPYEPPPVILDADGKPLPPSYGDEP